MQAIVNFFEGIGDVILALVEFVVSFFSDLVWIIQTLAWAVASIPSWLVWLPSEVYAIIFLMISIVVIYKVTGREG